MVVALGCPPEQLDQLVEQYALAQTLTAWFRPLFVSNQPATAALRRHGFAHEHVPTRDEWCRHALDDDWEGFLRGRLLEIAETHRVDAVVQHRAGWDVDYRALTASSVAGLTGIAPTSSVSLFHQSVEWLTPAGATVMVVSKGDPRLIELPDRTGWHFPRGRDGEYLGYHPADSDEAIAHLEALRAGGAGYLAFPDTAFWWLDYYQGLAAHLAERYRLVGYRDDACMVWSLRRPASAPTSGRRAAVRPRRRSSRRASYDIVMLSDLRLVGGSTRSIAEEIRAQHQAGYSTAVVHVPTDIIQGPRAIDPAVRRAVVDGAADLVLPRTPLRARAVVCRLPAAFRAAPPIPPDVVADTYLMVANQAPLDPARTRAHYQVADVARTLKELFAQEVTWAPIGPAVRAALEGAGVVLHDEDWVNILDVDRWRADRSAPCSDRPVLGRHSRPHWQKWPATAAEIAAAYPDDPGLRVRILGGADVPVGILGRQPPNWEVWPYGGLPVREFLRRIDFFVYYHHPLWVEAFGRTILEAMASGAVPVLPPHFEPLFGDSCCYAVPDGVRAVVGDLAGDWRRYRAQSRKATQHARERFGHEAHHRRLLALIGQPQAQRSSACAS